MTGKFSPSDSNRSTSTHNKPLGTGSADNLRPVTDSELDLVTGGNTEITVSKPTDVSSSDLFLKR